MKAENSYMGTGHIICKKAVVKVLKNIPINIARGERELVGLFNLLVSQNESIAIFQIGEQYFNINQEEDYYELLSSIHNIEEI